jgi:hypothetical protein
MSEKLTSPVLNDSDDSIQSITEINEVVKSNKTAKFTGFLVDRTPELLEPNMRPYESFAFKLGLEVVMASYGINASTELVDLNRHLTTDLEFKSCTMCDFQTESAAVMDQHLTEPHGSKWVFKCNFCEFRTRIKEQYRSHIELEHRKLCRLEKPFVSDDLMCPYCDFECSGELDNDQDRLERHIRFSCIFKDVTVNSQFIGNFNSEIIKYSALYSILINILNNHFVISVISIY